jgi:hypothetical protein
MVYHLVADRFQLQNYEWTRVGTLRIQSFFAPRHFVVREKPGRCIARLLDSSKQTPLGTRQGENRLSVLAHAGRILYYV